MPRWRWLMTQLSRRLWVRASLIGAMGVLAAALAAVVDRYIPWQMPGAISSDAIDSILTIIASSMLAVTTFSLNIMVSAYGSAANGASPRATRLLIEDRVAQTVLSTFIGSFLFGIVGLIVLKTGAYGERGRSILFVVTIAVIALVVVSLLRWIDHLTRLGRVGETADRVEAAAREAIEARLREPCLGGVPLRETPAGAFLVRAEAVGHVQHIDMPALSAFCEAKGAEVFVHALPGAFIYPRTALASFRWKKGALDLEAARKLVARAFSIGDERSFDQDPRFGLAVMSEIASRALSPAVNDPGTAIDVVGRSTRLLSVWALGCAGPLSGEAAEHPHVHVPPLAVDDLFEDAFMVVARDGAGMIEVQLRIQKALAALGRMGGAEFKAAAARQSSMAFARAEAALSLEADRLRLREAVDAKIIGAEAGAAPAPP